MSWSREWHEDQFNIFIFAYAQDESKAVGLSLNILDQA
jgi:hypothetical protein